MQFQVCLAAEVHLVRKKGLAEKLTQVILYRNGAWPHLLPISLSLGFAVVVVVVVVEVLLGVVLDLDDVQPVVVLDLDVVLLVVVLELVLEVDRPGG